VLPGFSLLKQCSFVRFEVFTAVTMKNVVFWDVSPCGSCKNRRCGGTELFVCFLVFFRSVRRLVVRASVVPNSPILVTIMKEALSSSETSVLPRGTRRNIPENRILQCSFGFEKCEGLRIDGCEYKECRLLEYKISVRTSQETHFVSAT
jgi:hypothetical protein